MPIPAITTVIGSGSMGPGIAALLARSGSQVRLNDISQDALDRARKVIDGAAAVLDELGTPSVDGGSVTYETDLRAALDGADFVIEAVPEKLELKQTVLAQVEDLVDPATIIATNTSGIPITTMAETLQNPERFIGMHWSNPPHLIPMIEVIRGEQTSEEVEKELVTIVESFGYEAVREKEKAGFVENRVLYAVLRECMALLEEGIATQQDLDTCIKWGVGYKLAVIGPMRLVDMAGLDIYESVAGYLNQDLDDRKDVPELVGKLTAAGRLGMKSGQGLYDYAEGEVDAKRADIIKGLVAVRKTLSEITPV